ncbi:hypothetical protein ACFT6Z_04715 [Streptomyces sp. NPDC057131]|uniref:hypothetical protein n=1 Tax=Streptomyces sp. NPDC057131 TaxID=3346027 RepID=UPI00362A10BD
MGRTRDRAEALAPRGLADRALPRIDRLVDAYDALGADRLIPVGGRGLERIAVREPE